MKKLIASFMLGILLVLGVFATADHSTNTAMEVEPSVFSVDLGASSGSLF